MGSKACYAISKAAVGGMRGSGGRFNSKEDGTLALPRDAFDLVKWIGTAYIGIFIMMLVSFIAWWKIVFFACLGIFVLTYFATVFVILGYMCLSEHEDDPNDRYTWQTGWTVFKRVNTIMYFGFTLWFKNELKMM